MTESKMVYLKDYKPSPFLIDEIDLTVDLFDLETKVTSKLKVKRNPNGEKANDLFLNGEEIKFVSATLNGKKLSSGDYLLESEGLTIKNVPDSFVLEILNLTNPAENKALDGLYKSGKMFCTQNEPEGFRRITYYIDRPDVMAKFTTKVIADKELYPVLLSNGNPMNRGDLSNGRHFVQWQDPFKKPCYLFALVAGDLGLVKDTFKTRSGKKVELEIYCDKGNEQKCHHAMESLKKSMKWDEETFGLEYDLDIYMIVAVDSFNMGAMENKGLNIFNSAYVLADQKTATDQNFTSIEGVIAHEYFHNWTGNRITCRDWFQLTLKEGLTVYRDQEFSSDMNVRSVVRLQEVNRLRTMQFAEDGGPTAHPIKPTSYMEINNFYTLTIYEKGAEVIRMIATLLGKDGFRKGMDKYFELFDGGAVTTDDFIHAMSVANNNFDFTQFKRWYTQAGTPELKVSWNYDAKNATYTLDLEQSTPKSPVQDSVLPFHFPLAMGLIGQDGKELHREVIQVKKEKESFVFKGIKSAPTLSINRNFTAPIRVFAPYSSKELAHLMSYDTDGFNRVDACQRLAGEVINSAVMALNLKKRPAIDREFITAFGVALNDKKLDPATKALTLSLPAEELIKQDHNPINFDSIFEARKLIKEELARSYQKEILTMIKELSKRGAYELNPIAIGERDLLRVLFDYAMNAPNDEIVALLYSHYKNASNMTDEINSLSTLIYYNSARSNEAVEAFYKKWKHDGLVIQKWLTIQARSPHESVFEKVLELENDPVFDKSVPNFVRALLVAFATNYRGFHHNSGRGYRYIADKTIEYDRMNPQVAARLAQSFSDYNKVTDHQRNLMKPELMRIKNSTNLSKNVTEIVNKILA